MKVTKQKSSFPTGWPCKRNPVNRYLL